MEKPHREEPIARPANKITLEEFLREPRLVLDVASRRTGPLWVTANDGTFIIEDSRDSAEHDRFLQQAVDKVRSAESNGPPQCPDVSEELDPAYLAHQTEHLIRCEDFLRNPQHALNVAAKREGTVWISGFGSSCVLIEDSRYRGVWCDEYIAILERAGVLAPKKSARTRKSCR